MNQLTQAIKTFVLWLAFVVACSLSACALTPIPSENHVREIFSIGYDAAITEATDLGNRTETSTSDYDTALIRGAITEEIPTEANRPLFGQTAEFKAAEGIAQASQTESLPTKIDQDGTIRVYDPATNTFGSYNSNRTTRTFFQPKKGAPYLTTNLEPNSEIIMAYICPVCEFPNLAEPPRSAKSGGGSYEICPSCGFQFGVSDDDRGISYEAWRRSWIAVGTPWSEIGIRPPPDWDAKRQLGNL